MMWWAQGWSWAGWWGMGLAMLVFWSAVIWLIVSLTATWSKLERNRFRGHRLSGEFVNVPIA